MNLQFTRASTVWPFVRFLNEIGAPTDQLLSLARIPPDLLEDPEALVPLPLAYRFLELAARREGGATLATAVASRTSAFDLGAFGASLRRAPTIGEYVAAAIGGINAATSGERFWLEGEGSDLRLYQCLPEPAGPGRILADTYTLALTINMLRRAVGSEWYPRKITLLGTDGAIGDRRLPEDAQVTTGGRYSSLTIERALLVKPMSAGGPLATGQRPSSSVSAPPMPDRFIDRLDQLIRALLPGGYPDIGYVAEVAEMSPRTLQRRLAERGLTYAGTVMQCRLAMAREWLAHSDLRITDIAAKLGYGDASNFSRAFRTRVGVSPQAFRARSAGTAEVRATPSA